MNVKSLVCRDFVHVIYIARKFSFVAKLALGSVSCDMSDHTARYGLLNI